jgi:hypothetical protein
MQYIFIGQLATFPFILFWAISLAYRIYRKSGYVTAMPVIIKLLISILFGTISLSSILIFFPSWWALPLGLICMHYCRMLAYFVMDHLINNKRFQPVFTHHVFWITNVLIVIGVGLGYLSQDSWAAFINNTPTHPTWAHYASGFFNYGVQIYFFVLVLLLSWQSWQRNKELTYMVRRIGFIISALLAILGFLSSELSLLSSLFSLPLTHEQLKSIETSASFSMVWVLLLSFLMPQSFLVWLLTPVRRVLRWRQEQTNQQLRYLHQMIIQIVPSVQLRHSQLNTMRWSVEISDARELIWSHIPYVQALTPRVEAGYLFTLLLQKTVIESPGIYRPAAVRGSSVTKHNRAVAKHLKRYQRSLVSLRSSLTIYSSQL